MAFSPPRSETISLQTSDGFALHATLWRHQGQPSEESPARLVILVHGLGEHHGRYAELAETLAEQARSDVFAFDFRGHGQSSGKRGVVGDYDDFLRDLDCAVAWARAQYPQSPLFVLAHSNGGLAACRWVLRHPGALAGLILSNPAIRLRIDAPRWKVALGRILLKVAPWVTLSTPVRPECLTRDPERQTGLTHDPWNHNRISAPLYFGMIDAGKEVENRFGEIQEPLLLLLSGADAIVDPQVARAVFERSGNPRKALIFVPDAMHEPFQDLGRERWMSEAASWIVRSVNLASS